MMPMYMNSSQPSQMRPQGHYHQGFGNYPHNMTINASSPVPCECWPTPSPCYGSCTHGNFPAYNAYWSPCYPPQVPYHPCCINQSGFQPHASHSPHYIHQPFPVGYQPSYDSEQDVPGKYRCTQCSPQICYPKNDRGIVIEEHDPEIDKGNKGEAVLPVRLTNCSYPITCIPHENPRNQDHGSSLGSGSHDQPPENMKVQESDLKCWNDFLPFGESNMKPFIQNQDRKIIQNGKTVELPFDISKLKSLVQGQDLKEAQIQKIKEEPGQLPFPVLWIPSYGKQEDVEASESRECSNGGRKLKSFPSNQSNEGQIAQCKGKEGNFVCNVPSDAGEKSSMRNIPVENNLQEPRNIPVKLSDVHLTKPTEPTKRVVTREPVENTKKKQSLSSPKASKLPPVCLRVDPLPKSKNGGSKALSPPRRKEQPLTSEETKVASPLSPKKAETKTVPEARNVKCEDAKTESVESDSILQGASCGIVKPCESKENRGKPAKKTFTEEEAVRIIQSRYRGYDVRRWEPIKKLKEIATVREQMGDVKKRIQALQVSSDQHIEGKEIVILGEMVMSLLLKLDSVQGLHPSIRDCRKLLARELSDIQEKLDSLKNSSVEMEAVEEQVEITSQTSGCPVNLEHSQLAEDNKMVSESNTEKVLPPPDEHPMSLMNLTDEQLVDEAEGTGLSETLTTDHEAATETGISDADSTAIKDKIEAVETVLPRNPSSADGNVMTVTNFDEDKVMVDNVLPLEKDVELSEIPVGVVEDEKQLLKQDISSYARDPQTASQEETEVNEVEISEETKKLMEENKRFRETMETLVNAGREQLQVISNLADRVESLEKKMSQKKKKKRNHIGPRKPNHGKQATKPTETFSEF